MKKNLSRILCLIFVMTVLLGAVMALNVSAAEATDTIDLTKQGYTNQTTITSVTSGNTTLTFSQGSGSTTPKYYTSGTAVRLYAKGTLTVSANGKIITNIVITFGSSDGSNTITADCGQYDSNRTWTGSSDSVIFTVGGTSGHRRIKSVEVTYTTGGDPSCAHANQTEISETPATCTEAGTTAGVKCIDCDEIISGCDEIPATGHSGGTATCTALAVCDNCDEGYGELADHSYDNGTCSVCGEKQPSTLTITTSSFNYTSNSYGWYTWNATASNGSNIQGTGYVCKNLNSIQLNGSKNGDYIYNTTALPGKIVSITLTKASGTDRNFDILTSDEPFYYNSSASLKGQATAAKKLVTTNGVTWEFDTDHKYFAIVICDSSAAYLSSIEIEYSACSHANQVAINEAKDATCTEDGITAGSKCADCGEIITPSETIPATENHTYVDGVCSVCGAKENCTHEDLGYYVAGVAATCTQNGVIAHYTCNSCKELISGNGEILETTEIPALGHNLENVTGTPATDTVDGLTDGERCLRCDYTTQTVIWSQKTIVDKLYELTTGATLANGSTTTFTLTGVIVSVDEAFNTGYNNITVTIKVNGADENKTLKCYRLSGTGADTIGVGDTITVTGTLKDYNGTKEFDQGCTLDSYTTHECVYSGDCDAECNLCGKTRTVADDATHGNAVTVTGTPPTCQSTGTSDSTVCDICGAVMTPAEILPTIDCVDENGDGKCDMCDMVMGSKIAEFIPGSSNFENAHKLDTVTVDGVVLTFSKADGSTAPAYYSTDETFRIYNGNTMTVSAYKILSIDIEANSDAYKCSVTDLTNIGGEGSVVFTATEAVRIKKITVVYIECTHENTEDIAEVGATCTTPGTTAGEKCNDCGVILSGCEIIDATGHTEAIIEAVAPTCTSTGLTEGTKCSVCNEILKAQETVEMIDHTYDSAETTKAPTCTEEGEMTFTCNVCKQSYTESIPALGHSYIFEITKDPSCTEKGERTYTCSVCGDSYTDDDIETTAHTYDADHKCTACGQADPFYIAEGRYFILAKREKDTNYQFLSGSLDGERYAISDSGFDSLPTALNITDGLLAYIFVIENNGDGTYKIYAENITEDAKYLGWTKDNTGEFVAKDNAKDVTIEINKDGLYNIYFADGSDTRYLSLNATASNKYAAWYKLGQTNDLALVPAVHKYITSAQVNVGSDLTMKYYISLPVGEDIANYSMVFTMNGKAVTVTEYEAAGGEYMFAFKGITPQAMGDSITAELVKNGETVAVLDNYSVKTNLKNLLNKTLAIETKKDSDEMLISLISNMLMYGQAAQSYVNHNTGNLIVDGDADAETIKANATNDAPAESDAGIIDLYDPEQYTPKIIFKSVGVKFDTVNRIYVRLQVVDASAIIENATVTVEVDLGGDGTATPTTLYLKDFTADGDIYTIYTDPIKATQFAAVFTFTLNDGEEDVQMLTYSVNSYVCAKQNSSTPGLADLVKTLYNYGYYAELYNLALELEAQG